MAETKAKKWEILNFIEGRGIITHYDLMERFGYTYSYAAKKLSLLKRQGLISNLRDTPSTSRGQWCLTDKGQARLYYLCCKFGVLTDKEKKKWREWLNKEEEKPFEERRIWRVEGYGVRMIKVGECGATLREAKEAADLNRELSRG